MEFKDKGWAEVSKKLPQEGQLCVVYFPIGTNAQSEETCGPSTLAYYREGEGWVRSDTPSLLRWKPYYWKPINLDTY